MLAWRIPSSTDETFFKVIRAAEEFQLGQKSEKEGLWVEFGSGSLAGAEAGLVSNSMHRSGDDIHAACWNRCLTERV